MRVNIAYLPMHSAYHRKTWYCLEKLRYVIRQKFVILVLLLTLLWLILLHYYNFIITIFYCVTFIQVDNIENHLEPVRIKTVNPVCSIFEKYDSTYSKNFDLNETALNNLHSRHHIRQGGAWEPIHCIPQHHVAIIVPYRDRETQLKIFLSHMHGFLQKQSISYQIFVIEQKSPALFNRGKLFNIGYMEALKIKPFHCFIFHDVDLMPTNPNNIYACTKQPRHMSVAIDIFDYELPYCTIFGGAIAMLHHQFRRVNGFSNLYFGWGGEDDDLFQRLSNYYSICRFSKEVSEYVMLNHKKQTQLESRWKQLESGPFRFKTDGLNTLARNYTVANYIKLPLETRILVDL
uniref:Beta-1,4-N-acetylgalactosaminyltransferase n=1 Tax=Cacopsylla melanoneura TaxID=428564 RepID=A0A8D8S4A2_9HEMI